MLDAAVVFIFRPPIASLAAVSYRGVPVHRLMKRRYESSDEAETLGAGVKACRQAAEAAELESDASSSDASDSLDDSEDEDILFKDHDSTFKRPSKIKGASQNASTSRVTLEDSDSEIEIIQSSRHNTVTTKQRPIYYIASDSEGEEETGWSASDVGAKGKGKARESRCLPSAGPRVNYHPIAIETRDVANCEISRRVTRKRTDTPHAIKRWSAVRWRTHAKDKIAEVWKRYKSEQRDNDVPPILVPLDIVAAHLSKSFRNFPTWSKWNNRRIFKDMIVHLRCMALTEKNPSFTAWSGPRNDKSSLYLSSTQIRYIAHFAVFLLEECEPGTSASLETWLCPTDEPEYIIHDPHAYQVAFIKCKAVKRLIRSSSGQISKTHKAADASKTMGGKRLKRVMTLEARILLPSILTRVIRLQGTTDMRRLLLNGQKLYKSLQAKGGAILSIDTEGWQQHHSTSVVQVGVSWVKFGKNSAQPMRQTTQYIVQEYASISPIPALLEGERCCLPLAEVKIKLIDLFTILDTENTPMLLLAHDVRAELMMLTNTFNFQTQNYRWLDAQSDSDFGKVNAGTIVTDSQILYSCFQSDRRARSLFDACQGIGIPANKASMHNAANDAVYALQLSELIMTPAPTPVIDLTGD